MKTKTKFTLKLIALAWLALSTLEISPCFAQNTMFTYQGRVLDNGTNFTGTGQFQFALVTSTNANQTAVATANAPSGGYITGYTILTGGSGYVSVPAVTIVGGGGSGAAAIAHLTGGVVTSITVSSPGNGGYTSAPSVTIAPPPAAITYTTYWSNDGTSINGSEPVAVVIVGVTNGLFTVALGDTTIPGMASIGASLFTQAGLQLQIWFNDGVNGFAALSPVQNLTSAPYADVATYAGIATYVSEISAAQLGDNPVFSGEAIAASFSDPNGLFIGGDSSTIGAGGNASAIGGGEDNDIGLGGSFSTIGGGWANGIGTNSYGDTISGGVNNHILANESYAVIGGGEDNQIVGGPLGDFSVICGGDENSIGSNALAVIGGGVGNQIGSGGGSYDFTATISGGYYNTIGNNTQGAVIAGGVNNQIGAGTAGYDSDAAIVGGYENSIGTNNEGGFIGGGDQNQIGAGKAGYNGDAAIVGGYENTIGTNAFASTICGGEFNVASGNYSLAAGYEAQATNNDVFVWGDGSGITASTVASSVTFRASGGYRFFTGGGSAGAQLAAGATAWSTLSDRNAKKNFKPVDTVAVLNTLASIPIQRWNYKWEKDTDVPNIGPMAQDFKHAFYPGRDDKSITTLEFDGVELAAIQGLNQKVEAGSTDSSAGSPNPKPGRRNHGLETTS